MGVMGLDAAAGIGGMLKEGTTLADGVDEAVLKNIGAARQLAEIVRTSLGPNGRKKLIINHLGKTLVSSDCATIVKELEVVHPAARILALAAGAQASEAGDGTNFVVSLAGELLHQAEELLREGLHTSEIVRGYEIAYEEMQKIVPTLAVEPDSESEGGAVVFKGDVRDVDSTATIVAPVVGAKHEGLEDVLAPLVAEACALVMPAAPAAPHFKADQVRIAKIRGGDASASAVLKGMVLPRDSETSVKSARNAKVAVFGCGIEAASTETKGTVLIRSAQDLLEYNKTEERALEKIIKEIADSGVTVCFCHGTISDMSRHFLEKYQLLAVRTPSKFDIRRVCKATGALTAVRLGAPTPEEMGFLAKLDVTEIGNKTVCVLDQTASAENPDGTAAATGGDSAVATVVLRASTASLLDDLERAVDHGVATVRALAKDPRLVRGAAAFEAQLASKLRAFAKTCTGLEQYAASKFAEAFECVPRALADNAGADATQVVTDLRAQHDAGNALARVPDLGSGTTSGFGGLDLDRDAYDPDGPNSLAGAGAGAPPVYDSLAIKESAIRLAVDAALTILRVDQLIMSKPAGGPKVPPQGGP